MRLFTTAFWMILKHSSRRLLCLVCVLGVCAGGVVAVFFALPAESRSKASIAVINLDQNPISQMALQTAASMDSLSELLELRFIEPHERNDKRYTATVTIPDGFLDSVMNGENKPPLVEVSVSSPLEAIWVGQLAQAGAQYLTTAQRGIYTVQEGVDYGESLSPRTYNLLLADVNITFMKAFIDRLTLTQSELLSASGVLTLPQYYLAAVMALLFLCYGFLYQPSVESIRRFSRSLNCNRQTWALFSAAYAHILVLTLAAMLPFFLLTCTQAGFAAERLAAMLMFALFTGGFALFLSLLLRNYAACATACILLSAGMGLCSGALMPLSLMPSVFARIASFTVTCHAQRLVGVLVGEPMSPLYLAQAGGMALLLLVASALLWYKTGEVQN